MALFANRDDAGRQLADRLEAFSDRKLIVLGLPRGGVPVAGIVAESLGARLDVVVIRKLGAPRHPEYAVGAIGEGDVRIVDDRAMRNMGVNPDELASVERDERAELARRSERFRGNSPPLDLADTCALIVDDGIATGSTAGAACQVARALGASDVVVAAPVASAEAVVRLSHLADEVIVLEAPEPFYAVGQFYDNFDQTTDAEVIDWLDRGRGGEAAT